MKEGVYRPGQLKIFKYQSKSNMLGFKIYKQNGKRPKILLKY